MAVTNLDALSLSGALAVTGAITGALNTENLGLPSILTADLTYEDSSGSIASIASGEVWFIHSVLVNVTESFAASGDDAGMIIGDGNDADGFIVLSDTELQTTDTEGTGFTAGWQGMSATTLGAYLDANHNSFVYAPGSGGETIDYEISGTAMDAGAATVYVIYTRVK